MPRLARRSALRVAAAVTAVALVPMLSACGNGFNAGTTTQRPSGNGSNTNLGPLQLRDITLVQGPQGSSTGTVILTIVNSGAEADALVGAKVVDPAAGAAITGPAAAGGRLALASLSRTRIGYDSDVHIDVTGFSAAPTQFVSVELQFEKAGRTTVQVMAVLPTGIYAGITPLPAAVA